MVKRSPLREFFNLVSIGLRGSVVSLLVFLTTFVANVFAFLGYSSINDVNPLFLGLLFLFQLAINGWYLTNFKTFIYRRK